MRRLRWLLLNRPFLRLALQIGLFWSGLRAAEGTTRLSPGVVGFRERSRSLITAPVAALPRSLRRASTSSVRSSRGLASALRLLRELVLHLRGDPRRALVLMRYRVLGCIPFRLGEV